MKKKGFTLTELLAIIVILGILTSIIVPNVLSIIKNGREKAYNVLIDSFEENARLYATRHREETEEELENNNYYIIKLQDLKKEGLLKTPINDPRTNDPIPLTKEIIITRETDKTLDICYKDRGCYIPVLLVNILTDENNVVSGNKEGLHYDSSNDYYYFRGSNPNNFVLFNDYLWRVVKVNNDGTIKLIFEGTKKGNGTIENGTIGDSVFDSGNSNNYNNNLTIKTNLQTWYDSNIISENKSKIVSTNWCKEQIAYNASGTPKSTFITDECTQKTTNITPIGLLYGSEYLSASLDGGCTTAYKTTSPNGTTCKNKNYLYKENYSYFTMTPTTTSTDVWDVKSTGSLGIPVSANSTEKVRPVITLINGVLVNRGDGSFNNPYEIKDIVNIDRDMPEIAIIGDNPVNIYVGETYVDEGATATDETDGDLTDEIVVLSNVNPSVEGTYTVTYVVSDRSGNRSSKTRIVNVIPPILADFDSDEGVNKPKLIEGMTAIKWEGNDWVKVDDPDNDTSWYDYANQEWANAVTGDCETPGDYDTCSM